MTEHWLARYAGAECCDLVTTGRRTGQRHRTEIWFGVIGDAMYLISGNGERADWFRNLQQDPHVAVEIDGATHAGVARVVWDRAERARVGDVMGAKYVWGGDPSIGLTYQAWCYDVPAVAVEFGEPDRR